jgi:DNA-binding transcriptional LysR family regulator
VADDLAQGRLLHIAPQWRAAPLPVWLVYPQARFYPARLRRFLDVIRAAMPGAVTASAPAQRGA